MKPKAKGSEPKSAPAAKPGAKAPKKASSATSSSTDVRSPTNTSTQAHTSDNVTVTGGAGAGDTTVHIYPSQPGTPKRSASASNGGPTNMKIKTDKASTGNRPKDADMRRDRDRRHEQIKRVRST